MANTLKIKIILLIGALSFLVFLEMYRNNFYKEVTLSPWRELNWDDFQGTIKPFTQYDAGISSKLYLEIDSMDNYYAYAAQNNQKSWVRGDARNSSELLRHEQYHFNITEVFARKMNEFIGANPGMDFSAYKKQIAIYRGLERQMQARYDLESEHSINESKQWVWEYKIDSMLLAYSDQPQTYTEQYSGATIYFSSKPESEFHLNQFQKEAFREAHLEKYGMGFGLTAFQKRDFDAAKFTIGMQEAFAVSYQLISHEKFGQQYAWIVADTVENIMYYQNWYLSPDYQYSAFAWFYSDLEDSAEFSIMAKTFVNSLEVSETSQYWKEKSRLAEPSKKQAPFINGKAVDEDYPCMIVEQDLINGFYGSPMIIDEDTLILPYQIMNQGDSSIQMAVLLLGQDIYTSERQSTEHIFKVPVKNLPDSPFQARMGYLLREDSAKSCYKFHNQSIQIDADSLKE